MAAKGWVPSHMFAKTPSAYPVRHVVFLLGIVAVVGGVLFLNGAAAAAHASKAAAENSGASKPHIVAAYGKLPLSFEANQGQTDPQVKFLSRGRGYTLFLTATEAVLTLQQAAAPTVVRMKLIGANPRPEISGVEELASKCNYFIGNGPEEWRTNVPRYRKVKYQNVYPGIDLVYYGTNQQQLEYDFIVAPGADPKAITLNFDGADRREVNTKGDLLLYLPDGEVRFHKPYVYQEAGGDRREVTGGYVLKGGKDVTFEVGSYDASKPLIIDPVLVYSTYLGGNSEDFGQAIVVDAQGNSYVTGETGSINFPTLGAFQMALGGSKDTFVAKLNVSGDALVYSTYLGGSGDDTAFSITVDDNENVYVTGETSSTDFPTANPLQVAFGGGSGDAFVTKLSASGDTLVYSTYLGGNGFEVGRGIAVDGLGNAYVTGETGSTDFPIMNAFQPVFGGGFSDAFVAKLNPNGSALDYSTYLGGRGSGTQNDIDAGFGIDVDTVGSAYVTGLTRSSDFPTVNPLQASCASCAQLIEDAFVAKLEPTGTALVYSTFLGGSGADAAQGIAVDNSRRAYIAGTTASTNFPTRGPLQAANAGGQDVFVTRLDSSGTALDFSTYLGGQGPDLARGIVVDGSGSIYVTGETASANFPTVNPLQPAFGGGSSDAFITRLNPSATAIVYSTFLGGSGNDSGQGLATDGTGNAYVTGLTNSTDFPTANPFQAVFGGGTQDAFVARISFTVDEFLASCPSTTEVAAIDADLTLTFDVDDTAGTLACTSANGSVDLTPLQALAYQSIRVMQQLSFDVPLLWTSKNLYEWFIGTVDGIRFDDGPGPFCCFPSNVIHIRSAGLNSVLTDRWDNGPSFFLESTVHGLISVLTHEARHSDGPIHTCSSVQDISIKELGPKGIDYYREEWLAFHSGVFLSPGTSISDTSYRMRAWSRALGIRGNFDTCDKIPFFTVPSSINFGSQLVGSSTSRILALTAGSSTPVTIASVTLAGANASDFSLVGRSCSGVTVGPSCVATVKFTPTAFGMHTAELVVTDDAPGSPRLIPLGGLGIPPGPGVALSPTRIDFGSRGLSSRSFPWKVTLLNTGSAPLVITSIAASSSEFTQTNNCGSILLGGADCLIGVSHSPTTPGTHGGAITIVDDAPGSPHTIELFGSACSTSDGTATPIISSLSPSSATAGGPGFTLTVTGSGFTGTSGVFWNGSGHGATSVCSNQITAYISASRIANPGTAQVDVLAGSSRSNALTFTINSASAEPPVINTGGVVHGASFAPGAAVAPGSIVSVFGTNLTSATESAGATPLPTVLGGAAMQFNGSQAVPKFFASPLQINIQVPWELVSQAQAPLTDRVGGETSNAEMAPLATFSPGLFATNQQGTGQGAILIASTGGMVAAPAGLFPGSRPVMRGTEFIEIFCTGFGPVTNQPTTGTAASSSPLSETTTVPTVTIGGVAATVSFSGLTPGFVGLYQVNVQVPNNAPVGNAVDVVLAIGGVTSNTVTIAVQ